jgi:hypothetical protein
LESGQKSLSAEALAILYKQLKLRPAARWWAGFAWFSFYLPRLFSCSHFAAVSITLMMGFLPLP